MKKREFFLTLRNFNLHVDGKNIKTAITLDYYDRNDNEPIKESFFGVHLSQSLADMLLRAFRRHALRYGRNDCFPFYFTPLFAEDGKEYVKVGKYILPFDELEKKKMIINVNKYYHD